MKPSKRFATTKQSEITRGSDASVGAPIRDQLGKLSSGEAVLADDRRRALRKLLQQAAEEHGVTCRAH